MTCLSQGFWFHMGRMAAEAAVGLGIVALCGMFIIVVAIATRPRKV